ncbi:MAG: histidine phosphatase family protein [Gammaproteobacteria bacterium]
MSSEAYRQALRRRPLFTPLYASVALLTAGVLVLGWIGYGLWQPPGTVIVVRHTEKAPGSGDDPTLSDAGIARAQRVATVLAAAGVDAIYATQYRRTVETATPLAERLSLPLHVYDAGGTQGLLESLDDRHRAETVVVVGHSNTVPEIVEALSGEDVGPIGEERYGDVFVVVRPRWGRATVTRLFVE